MTRRLEVEFINASCAYVRGWGSRDLITEIRGRPPVYATLSRAWACLPKTARDVIAVAESRGYEVFVSGTPRPVTSVPAPQVEPSSSYQREDASTEVPDPGAGLW